MHHFDSHIILEKSSNIFLKSQHQPLVEWVHPSMALLESQVFLSCFVFKSLRILILSYVASSTTKGVPSLPSSSMFIFVTTSLGIATRSSCLMIRLCNFFPSRSHSNLNFLNTKIDYTYQFVGFKHGESCFPTHLCRFGGTHLLATI